MKQTTPPQLRIPYTGRIVLVAPCNYDRDFEPKQGKAVIRT